MDLEFGVKPGLGPCLLRKGAVKVTREKVKRQGRFKREDSTSSVMTTSYGDDVPMYLLVKSVTHAPDPRTLPDSALLGAAAEKAAGRALRTLLSQSTGGSAPAS
jgi:hypothetical protein